MFQKEQHIELLTQIPFDCFASFGFYIRNIGEKAQSGKPISWNEILLCYQGLYLSISNYSQSDKTKQIIDLGNCYKFRDYVNPRLNHISGYVYKSKFLLPKMYKNALFNPTPSYVCTLVLPKQNTTFKDAMALKQDFITMVNRANNENLDQCYHALNNLIAHADFVLNPKIVRDGHVILCQELIDLLYNQSIILNAYHEMNYAPQCRQEIIKDVAAHKQAMFSELQK